MISDFFEYGYLFIFRYIHVIAGITWIGMLYYFNFVQTEYFKEAEADAKKDAMAKLAPRALWWFRWGAAFTFASGLYLFHKIGGFGNFEVMAPIWVGAVAGTFMFLNVWLIIWPAQQIVLGMKEGDGPSNAAKAGLASRTNTLFSGPNSHAAGWALFFTERCNWLTCIVVVFAWLYERIFWRFF